jgi:hypothetical protein
MLSALRHNFRVCDSEGLTCFIRGDVEEVGRIQTCNLEPSKPSMKGNCCAYDIDRGIVEARRSKIHGVGFPSRLI